ncbi:short-chain dehydrogenase [Trichoderma gamsii]|uniref:Short-chain dehydrogenase n=1 Tax=Trichoderma gamsii TaxID=398673 RepID=A0A2P4Z760_9HYPO|nr:short-chain dehydrogenase [Trichoderma gamsii]PON20125.1 short-chain dehydrogenase [Trichoderma gamsii]
MGFFSTVLYEQYFLSIPEPTASFSHKTIIITGANSGLGKEAARYYSKLGCTRLILAVRNVSAGEAARKDILATTSAAESTIAVWEVDMASFDSVVKFTQRAINELDRLDILVCNAAISTSSFSEMEGYESIATVNVLSTLLMATRLLPLLEKTAALGPVPGDPQPRPPHLSMVTSDTHMMSSFKERNEPYQNLFSTMTTNCKTSGTRMAVQYATSKLLVLLLMRDMVYRQLRSGPSTGIKAVKDPETICPVIINGPNPGLCQSGLTREFPVMTRIMNFALHARPTKMGASAIVNSTSAGWETNGQYLSANKVQRGSDLSWDAAVAENLRKAADECLQKFQTA